MLRKLAIVLFWKKNVTLKNLTPPTIFAAHPSNLSGILTTKLLRSSRSRILEFAPQIFFRTAQSQNFIEKSTLKKFGKILNFFRGDPDWKLKIRLLEALGNLIVGLYKNFQVSISKTVGGVGFLPKTYFSLLRCCQFLAHGCQNRDIDLKFGMGGRIDTIFMWIKFGDDPISSLDFSFTGGGVPLNSMFSSF